MSVKRFAMRLTSFPLILVLYIPSAAIILLVACLEWYSNNVTSYNQTDLSNFLFFSFVILGVGSSLLFYGARYFVASSGAVTQSTNPRWGKAMAVLAIGLGLIPAVPLAVPILLDEAPYLRQAMAISDFEGPDWQAAQAAKGYAIQNDFDAAFNEVKNIQNPVNQDVALQDIWVFGMMEKNCSVLSLVVERLNTPANKELFAASLKQACP